MGATLGRREVASKMTMTMSTTRGGGGGGGTAKLLLPPPPLMLPEPSLTFALQSSPSGTMTVFTVLQRSADIVGLVLLVRVRTVALAWAVVVGVAREVARVVARVGKREVVRVAFVLGARAMFVMVMRAVARAVARAVTNAVVVAGGDSGGGIGIGDGSRGGEVKGSGVGGGGALYIIVPVKNILIYTIFSYMKLT
jgi:hypothetical protein